MHLFRVEDKSGDGPWNGNNKLVNLRVFLYMQPNFGYSDSHPTPFCEELDFKPGIHHSATISIEQLFEWFYSDEVIECLEKNEFVIAEYEIESHNVGIGKRQAIFKKSDATLIAKHNVKKLFLNSI